MLALAVCLGLFVMHGLDDPSAHGTDLHPPQPAAAHPEQAADGHVDATEDHQCTDCAGALHVVIVCVAVLAAVGLALSWPRLRHAAAALVDAARDLDLAIAAPPSSGCSRPAWVRLAVMLC